MTIAWQKSRTPMAALALAFLFTFAQGAVPGPADNRMLTCPEPDAELSEKGSDYLEFYVDKDPGVPSYAIQYFRYGVAGPRETVAGSTHTFNNLPSGNYVVIVTAECGINEFNYIIIDNISL